MTETQLNDLKDAGFWAWVELYHLHGQVKAVQGGSVDKALKSLRKQLILAGSLKDQPMILWYERDR